MKYTENEMKQILEQEIEIPKKVDERLQDTYSRIRTQNKTRTTHAKKSWRKITAAAAVAALTLTVTGGTAAAAYLSEHTDFFQGMFGNTTKSPQEHTQVLADPDKDDGMMADLPGKEYVPVDEEKADALIGGNVTEVNITKEIGGHTLTIENIVTDGNGMLMSMTLEKPGGVTALYADDETNRTKGAYFSPESNFSFFIEDQNGIPSGEFMYVDTEKSTPDKYYIYDYMIWGSTESTPIQPRLHIYTYPVTLGELQEINETDTEKRDQIEVTEDYVDLPQCENVPMQSLNQDDTWICSYSPISMSINMSAQAPEEEAQDPYCIKYIELKYKDGTNYTIFKQDELDNTGYICGVDNEFRLTYNRIVNPDDISQIIINDNVYDIN
ncbi:DUF4179 domain-containing protein [Blautia marasmi]|uniref:DUF4179 domain-containing protein n=1 Tax=Blautia marasmi TaxID=1917868 RepID=UPI00266D05A2|nr:DUF4179 domain-containing protein [Blautia marasmi]